MTTNAALEERVSALERLVATLIGHDPSSAAPPGAPMPIESGGQGFWALWPLLDRSGPPTRDDAASGTVLFAGVARAPGVGEARWQQENAVAELLDVDWAESAGTFAALAHPIRLRLLRQLLLGAHSVSRLSEIDDLGTSGQLYHHLRELQAAGFVEQCRRNVYAIPTDRVVASLVMVAAALGAGADLPIGDPT